MERGAQFSKLAEEITVAARLGGGDLSSNPRPCSVVETARAANMPKDHVERAIKKGTGEPVGAHHEEIFYEACAPGAVVMVIEAATNNKNRTDADLRFIFRKHCGSLAAGGVLCEDRTLELTFDAAAEALRVGGIAVNAQKRTYRLDNTILVGDESAAVQVLPLYEKLEDNDDTQNVYFNFDIPEEVTA